MAQFIIGTAGHIDHGKSALVRRLTGTDPDRLAEEQERGMTIDLGFAFLNDDIAFIDVPGHEKFVKNMVAGVSTVHAALLVIAADDGIMPQTREHLDILRLLHLNRGMIALTKADLVDDEWLDLVEEEILGLVSDTFLAQAPIFRVSSITGAGIDELKQAVIELAEATEQQKDRGTFWMPVDRSFTIKGHGTVVTGSVLSGTCAVGDMLELLPDQRAIKIRGIQTHGHDAQEAHIGERAALNLQNISKEDVQRGDVLATPQAFSPSTIFDAKLSLLKSAPKALSNRNRVRLHIGTREVMARIKIVGSEKIEPGSEAYVQLFLEQSAVAMRRDSFVIRRYSPPLTIGGGMILNAYAKPVKRFSARVAEQFKRMEAQNPQEMVYDVLAASELPLKYTAITSALDLEDETIQKELQEMLQSGLVLQVGKNWMSSAVYERAKDKILEQLSQFHKKEPLRMGIKSANLQAQTFKQAPELFKYLIADLEQQEKITLENGMLRLASHSIQLSDEQKELVELIFSTLENAGFVTPPAKIMAADLNLDIQKVETAVEILQALGRIIRLEDNIFLTAGNIEKAKQALKGFNKDEISVSEFRELLNTSRKFAVPLLSYFDDLGMTERVGDVRTIK